MRGSSANSLIDRTTRKELAAVCVAIVYVKGLTPVTGEKLKLFSKLFKSHSPINP